MKRVYFVAFFVIVVCFPASLMCQPCKTAAEWRTVQDERSRRANASAKSKTMWSVIYSGFKMEKTKDLRTEYAPTGEEVREIEYYKNGLVRYQFDYSYDDSGRLLVSQVQFQGSPAGYWEYEYNSAGMVNSYKFIDTTGAVTRRYFFHYIDTSEILTTMCDSTGSTLFAITNKYEGHRDSGILIESTREVSGGIHDRSLVNEYMSSQWVAEKTINRHGTITKETRHESDEQGRRVKTVVIDGFGEKATETTFQYSKNGLLELIETRDGLRYLKSRVQFDYEYYD